MFVNTMLSIWLYGMLLSFAVIGFLLWRWYFRS